MTQLMGCVIAAALARFRCVQEDEGKVISPEREGINLLSHLAKTENPDAMGFKQMNHILYRKFAQ